MQERYERNRIYIDNEEQKIIKDCPIIIGGSGIGSVISECALRLGFENITIIDGDKVELSNLNRQNYTEEDISFTKVEAISTRLKAINKEANIKVYNNFITEENVEKFIRGHVIAINALDFTTDIPFEFDKVCQENNIPVIHPYNLGWEALVTVIAPEGLSLSSIAEPNGKFNEVNMVEYMSTYMRFWGKPQNWIEGIIEKYKNEKESLPPPQLSIASWKVAAICTHLLFDIATGERVKKFPEFYLSNGLNS